MVPPQEASGAIGISNDKAESAVTRKHECISSTAQAHEVWTLLQPHAKYNQPCALHITAIALSEALLAQQPHERDSVLRVLAAPTIALSLRELDLSYNHLDDAFWESLVPSAAQSSWTTLVTLNLADNMFTSKSLLPLARMIARCPKLTHLDVSLNPLQPLPRLPRQRIPSTSSTASELRSDNAQTSPFRVLAQSLESSQLSVLDLSCTGLSDDAIAALFEGFAVRQFTKLYLRSNNLHDATATRIAELLPNMRLQVLSLAGNCIENQGLCALAFALETSPTLETLDVEENQINERGISALYHALDGLAAPFPLRFLHLQRNQILGALERTLLVKLQLKLQEKILETHLLSAANERLHQTLVLTGKTLRKVLRMDTVLTDSYVKVALDTIRHCEAWSCLEEIDLSGNAVSESGCSEIGLYVSLHPRLRVLNLSRNAIDDGLELNSTLQELNLHDNHITDAGAKQLYLKAFTSNLQRKVLLSVGNKLTPECKAMLAAISQAHDLRKRFAKEFAHLEQLDFAGQSLRQYGVAAIAEMLTESNCSPACTSIDLSRNGLGDEGAVEVARLLRYYRPLLKIDLSFNDIGDDGAFALADALRDNATLTHLALHTSVEGSVVKPRLLKAGLTRLAQALETHRSITTIDLRDNITTPMLVPVYVQMLRCNPRIVKFNGSSAAVYLSRYES